MKKSDPLVLSIAKPVAGPYQQRDDLEGVSLQQVFLTFNKRCQA